MSISLKIYHHLPQQFRALAASWHGYRLNAQRYDSQTEKLVGEILERDYWSASEWREWRETRLAFVLYRAVKSVPFYRDRWAERRRNGDKSSWEYLENWEILEKQVLRERGLDFVGSNCTPAKMYHDHTSGTTGTSLNLWSTPETVKLWYAMFEARGRRWYGVSRNDRWAIIGGQLIVPAKLRRPPFWVWNAGLKQLYLSSYHLAPDLIKFYLDALVKYRVRYLLGYSSALYSLAQQALKEKRQDLKLDVVITNAEPLFDYQRETIAAAFDCPVRETYGMAETVAAACECSHNKMHQWMDTGIVEKEGSVENDKPADLICTGLVNSDMPLIRYRVGDCGTLSDEICSCGKTLPLFGKIEGRSDDVLYTVDGRRVGRLDPIFKNDLPVIEAQIVQQSLRDIVVKYVPTSEFNHKSEILLINRLSERMGDINVKLEEVAQIPRTNRGKFRAVICNLSATERASIAS